MAERLLPAELRAAFHMPEGGPYLLSHSVGCLPKAAMADYERRYVEPWRVGGGKAWDEWLAIAADFRAALAALFGGKAEDYCPQTNVSAALSRYLGALPVEDGRREILLARESFPSMGFVAAQAKRLGFEARFLPEGADPGDADMWRAAMGEGTALVLVTHVLSNSGRVLPVADIAAAARDAGARSIVDVAQSAGALAFDIPGFGVDAAMGSCVKYLCGGPGAAFLWIAPGDLPALDPADTGWFSHEDPFEMDIFDYRPAPDAARFWGGTPAIAPLAMALPALGLIRETGAEAIEAHIAALKTHFFDTLGDASLSGARMIPPIGGAVALECGARIDAACAALAGIGAHHDNRGSVLRLSFHAYTRPEEAEAAARAIAEL